MEPLELEQFQNTIDDFLLINRSILDQLTKLQDACSRLNRNVSKSATMCGCIKINVSRQNYPISEDLSLEELKTLMSSHIEGYPCEDCNERIEKEMGRLLFYLGTIANTLGISLSTVLENEVKRNNLLGNYSLK